MNLHENLNVAIAAILEEHKSVDIISPTFIAVSLSAKYGAVSADPHIAYGALEHFKQMARKVLAQRFDTDSDEADAYSGELFSEQLQQRYPIPHKRGEDPIYKRLEALTEEELIWNERALLRSADARTAHARALGAYRLSRAVA